jgi:hypothetical protein
MGELLFYLSLATKGTFSGIVPSAENYSAPLGFVWKHSKTKALSVPDEGYYSNVPDAGHYSNVPDEGYYSNVPYGGYYSNVPDEGYYSNVPDEGYYSNVPDEGYYSNVPDEGYSRNVSCALNLISTFLLYTCFFRH